MSLIPLGILAAARKAALGDTWTARTGANGSSWGIAFGSNTYLISGGISNNVQTSADGATWTSRLANSTLVHGKPASSGSLFAVPIYTNSSFSANMDICTTSADGINWSQRFLTRLGAWRAAAWGASRFVIPGFYNNINTGSSATTIQWSANGVDWFAASLALKGYDIAFGNGTFVVSNQNSGTCYTSTNASSWTTVSMPSSRWWQSVSFGNGMFIMGTDSTTYATSTNNGATWTERTFPATPSQVQNGIAWGDSQWVMFPNSNTTTYYTSPDGITWTAKTIGTSGIYNAGLANNRLFAMAGTNIQVSA